MQSFFVRAPDALSGEGAASLDALRRIRRSSPPRSGRALSERVDYESERKGVSHQLMMCEPLRGGRHVCVAKHRTRRDYAACVRDLAEVHYPRAIEVRLVQDMNTHDGASLYEAFCPTKARELLGRIEFHYTPKHGSWLNRAETEIDIMNRQCLDRRLDSPEKITTEIAAWETQRNTVEARIHWRFTLAVARQKLRKLYPSIED